MGLVSYYFDAIYHFFFLLFILKHCITRSLPKTQFTYHTFFSLSNRIRFLKIKKRFFFLIFVAHYFACSIFLFCLSSRKSVNMLKNYFTWCWEKGVKQTTVYIFCFFLSFNSSFAKKKRRKDVVRVQSLFPVVAHHTLKLSFFFSFTIRHNDRLQCLDLKWTNISLQPFDWGVNLLWTKQRVKEWKIFQCIFPPA